MSDLYQQLILDHAKRPRKMGKMADATHQVRGDNPLCGDRVKLFLCIDGVQIKNAQFTGEGCALSRASASLMCEAISGHSVERVRELLDQVLVCMVGEAEQTADLSKKLCVLAGVQKYPMRVKCASMPWRALETILAEA